MMQPSADPSADALAQAEVLLAQARDELRQSFDPAHGGFGRGTKFPTPQVLSLLVRQWTRDNDPQTRGMFDRTLRSIRNGAVYDHLGHGIHRYSTDPAWELPHFEKMLYDQALYVIALLDAWQATGDETFAATARDVLGYVRRVMTSPEGGFYSAEDAQSEGVEGRFYVWTPDQVPAVLGADDAKLFNAAYQVVAGGNFRDEASRRKIRRQHPAPAAGFRTRRLRRRTRHQDGRTAGSASPPPAPSSSMPANSASSHRSTTRCSPTGTA